MAEAHILEGTRENFPALVLENSRRGLVLVDFWSPAAGPSLRQREILMALAREYAGRFLLVTVNTDREPALSRDYGVRSIPSFKLFRHGRIVEEVRGMQPQADYRAILERHLQSVGDTVRVAAGRAWQGGERDRALQLLAEGAMAEPDNLALPALLAKFLMQLDRHAEAQHVLQSLPQAAREEPEIATLLAHLDFILTAQQAPARELLQQRLAAVPTDLDAHYQLAAVCLVADDYPACLETLMGILRQDRRWSGDRARRGLLAVFDTLGAAHELVRGYRSELFRLIY